MGKTTNKKETNYISVLLPEETIKKIDSILNNKTSDYSSRPDIIKSAIRFLEEKIKNA